MSGKRVLVRDYYTANLGDLEDRWKFLVQDEVLGGFSGLWFPGIGQPGEQRTIPYEEICSYDILIVHYLKDLEIKFSSAAEFLFNQVILLHRLRLFVSRISNLFLRHQRLSRAKRLQVLQIFHDRSLDDWDYQAGPEAIMTELYGHKWRRHPENVRLYRYYMLTLQSLEQSGDLVAQQHSYRITPQALNTLFQVEEDDRRHRDLSGQQTAMKWLTVMLVIVGLIQAGVSGCIPLRDLLLVQPRASASGSTGEVSNSQ